MKLEKYPTTQDFADRDLLIVVYREYQKRKSIYDRDRSIPSKAREWSKKVNEFVLVFNKLRDLVPKAEALTLVSGTNQKRGIEKLLKYVDKEVQKREELYPKWVRQRKMKYEDAFRQLQGMKSVFNKLLDLKETLEGVQEELKLKFEDETDQD